MKGMRKTFIATDLTGKVRSGTGVVVWFCSHSKERVELRRISDEEIMDAFESPDRIEDNRDYTNVHDYVKVVQNGTLRIGVRDEMEPFVLVTAFYQ